MGTVRPAKPIGSGGTSAGEQDFKGPQDARQQFAGRNMWISSSQVRLSAHQRMWCMVESTTRTCAVLHTLDCLPATIVIAAEPDMRHMLHTTLKALEVVQA